MRYAKCPKCKKKGIYKYMIAADSKGIYYKTKVKARMKKTMRRCKYCGFYIYPIS